MAKFIFHLNSPWRILRKILISFIPFLTLTACSGGPGEISFSMTSSSGESGLAPCGPEGPIDPGAAGFLCDIITSVGTLDPNFDPDDITYTLTLPFLTPCTYTITSTSGAASFTLTLNANPVNSGDPIDLTAPLPGRSSLVAIKVTDTNGNQTAYEIIVTRQSANNFAQEAYLKASNTAANVGLGDQFGIDIAISGDTLVVGARNEASNATGVNGDESDNSAESAGAAYVFVRSGTTWSQQAYLKASNTEATDLFGISVGISGDTIVVGAVDEDSDATGVIQPGPGPPDPPNNSDPGTGAAYVFVRSGTTWSQQAYLKASITPAAGFGRRIAISGDTILVGVSGGVETAYVFTRSVTTWSQQAILTASNTDATDLFGFSVAISGDTIVVGAAQEDSNATGVNGNQSDNSADSSGAAYVFTRSGITWSQQAYLKASNTEAGDFFGISVAISGEIIVVGAESEASNATGVNGNQSDNSAGGAGAAYVFTRSGITWSQQAYLKASNTEASDQFGVRVAISGGTIVVGGRLEDSNATGLNGDESDNSALASGAAYLFVCSGTTWSPQAYLKASNTEARDFFGLFVGISGDTIVVSAILEASDATGVNGDEFNNLVDEAGAAYVFR